MPNQYSDAYRRIQRMIAEEECVILDGGGTTELERVGLKDYRISDKGMWGTWTLYHAPYAALEVHRRYVATGCHLISTMTWSIITPPENEAREMAADTAPGHWMDVARLGLRLPRQAIDESEKAGQCAVAFSINGDINSPQQLDRIQLLARVFEESPPDLIIMETMSLIRDELTFPAVEIVQRTGVPVWLSFRRCRHSMDLLLSTWKVR